MPQKEDIFSKKHKAGEKMTYEEMLSVFEKNKESSLKTLIAMYKGQYFNLFLAIVFFAVKHSPVWVLPIVTANIINTATNPDESSGRTIIINVVVMCFLAVQNVASNYFHTVCYAKSIRRVERNLRSSMVKKLQQLSITFHNEMESGRIQSKIMRDVEQIETLSSQIFISVLSIVLNVAVSMTVVLSSSFTVFLFFLGTIPVAVIIRTVFRNRINKSNKSFRKEMEETSVSVMEMIELIPVTRAHALEDVETQRLDSKLENVASEGFKLDVLQSYFGSVSWAAFQIFQVICLGFTGYLAVKGEILPGDVVMYQTYFGNIVNQVGGIVTLIPIISKGLESVSSVGDILNCKEIEDSGNGNDIGDLQGSIEFKNVTFRYKNSETPVIEDFSLKINAGETVALVGASGAGKTTVVNMIIGFLRADSGDVLIDGKKMGDFSLKSYRKNISVVPQTPILFSGTLRENITYGKDDYSEESIDSAVRSANLGELIDSLPEGLDTKLTEHGGNLSGGQRQRISIARAFIRNPKILILDEATSALDTVSEKKIQDSVDSLVKDRTTIIVAHRLSTIRNADKIAVIGEKGLMEFGSYEELMAKKGEFYKLKSLQ